MRILVDHPDNVAGNPYLSALYDQMRTERGPEIAGYTHRAVLWSRWDVVNFNWPEWCLRRDRGSGILAFDSARLLSDVVLLKQKGARISWTAHNIRPHQSDSWGIVDRLTRSFTYLVDQVIATSQGLADELQRVYPALRNADHRIVPLSHYRGMYPDGKESRAEARERLGLPQDRKIVLSLGLIRAYKNIPALLRCMADLEQSGHDGLLLLAGSVADARLSRSISGLLEGLAGARGDLHFIPDESVQHYLRACDSLIVSTSLSVNSATAMLALSFDRPVMLPNRSSFAELAESVGAQWVHTYDGGIRPQVLERAFGIDVPEGSPRLEAYDPARIARLTYDAFSALVADR